MFGRQSTLSSGGNLIEFRAGKMNLVGKMVHPDTRKGMVYLTQADDGLIHFCWKDRNTGKVEDDLIVFPDDFEFKRVEQCTTGRVYVLKFKTSSRRMFFWLQEPKIDKDEDYCRRVNETMNNPPSARSASGNSDGGDLQYMLNNMSQQQLMQLFGGVGQMGGLSSLLGSMNRSSSDSNSSRAAATTPTSNRSGSGGNSVTVSTPENSGIAPRVPSAPKNAQKGASTKNNSNTSRITLPDLQNYLTAIHSDGANRPGNVDLSTALSAPEAINQIVSDAERAEALASHLPKTDDDETEDVKQRVKETLTSPQFQQAFSLFSSALQSGQLAPVVSQFDLGAEAVEAASTGDLEQFIKALEKDNKTEGSTTETKEKEEKEKDEDKKE